jgi:hypothetical protein
MNRKGESLSIHLGPFSNFVGSHVFNVAEEGRQAQEADEDGRAGDEGWDETRMARFYHSSSSSKPAPRCIMIDLKCKECHAKHCNAMQRNA